uniref:Carboxymuconolactone decarboxylase family protein n=1 Tax=Leptospirillum ferriphilum TaxID=178606 RepID=A0A7C3R2G1_9BACT
MEKKVSELMDLIHRLESQYPNETRSFLNFMQRAEGGAALSLKTKELINVALSVASQCEWCIPFHVKGAVDAGATRDELMESGFMAVLMHGGPALAYLTPLMESIDEFRSPGDKQ